VSGLIILMATPARKPDTLDTDLLWASSLLPLVILILTEVLQGFRADNDYQTAKSLLMTLTVFDMLGSEFAIKAGR